MTPRKDRTQNMVNCHPVNFQPKAHTCFGFQKFQLFFYENPCCCYRLASSGIHWLFKTVEDSQSPINEVGIKFYALLAVLSSCREFKELTKLHTILFGWSSTVRLLSIVAFWTDKLGKFRKALSDQMEEVDVVDAEANIFAVTWCFVPAAEPFRGKINRNGNWDGSHQFYQ